MRFSWRADWVHAALLGQPVALSRVALRARGHHVVPRIRAATGERNEVIPREALPELELILPAGAVLTPVSVACEQERVCDLSPELSRDVNEPDETNNRRPGDRECNAPNHTVPVRLHDLRLAV